MSSYRVKAYIYLLIVTIIWGAAGPIIKFTLGGIDPLPFLAYRFAISGLVAAIFIFVAGARVPKPKQNYGFITAYSLLAFPIALAALFLGLDRSTVLDMTVITLVEPLAVALAGALIFHDHVTKREKIGTAIVLAGTLFTTLTPVLMGDGKLQLTGNLFLLIFLLTDGSAALLAKVATRKDIPALSLTNLGFIIGAISIIPVAFFIEGPTVISTILHLDFKYHLGVWYMALISGNLGYFLWVLGQKSIEVSESAIFRYSMPIFGVPLAVLWLGEKMTSYFIIGAILVTAGIIVAEIKKRK